MISSLIMPPIISLASKYEFSRLDWVLYGLDIKICLLILDTPIVKDEHIAREPIIQLLWTHVLEAYGEQVCWLGL